MGNYVASDNAATTLAASITNSPTVNSITVADASKFPVVNHGGVGSDWSYATLYDASNNLEVVKVTRRDNASNTLSIVRGTAAGITGVTDANCRSWTSATTGVAVRLISQIITDIRTASVNAAADAAAAAASAAAAVAGVKVTNNDTTAGKLNDKITVTGNLTKAVINSGGDEQLQFGVNVPVTSVFGRTGAVTLQGSDVTGALGYTPYNFGATSPIHSGNIGSQSVNYASSAGSATTATTATTANALNTANNYTINSRLWTNISSQSLYSDGGSIGFLSNSGGWLYRSDNSGNLTATGNVIAYSDERLKKNWRPLPADFIERLARVRMGIFDRIDQKGVTQIGVGAQSMREVLAEAVHELGDGTLGVSYGNTALAACVALANEVVVLRAEIEKLKAVR